ncbi:MAG: branched-chain amino acid ABC transporter permease [Candidatus Bipolaricaulia bacterium]
MGQILVSSLLISALYALISIGFTLVFGVARVFNLAHGAFLMVGAYAAYLVNGLLGWDICSAATIAVAFTALFAALVYWGFIRYFIFHPIVTVMATLALSLLLEQLLVVIPAIGPSPRHLDPFLEGAAPLFGAWVPKDRLLGFLVSWLCCLALFFFIRRSRAGKAILATAQDRTGAALVGIEPERIYLLTFTVSGALAAIAGIFFNSWTSLVPSIWREPMIISFAIVILGGLGSILGSLVAAYLVGFLETWTIYTPALGPSWVGLPSLILLLVVLLLRPQGLFGVRRGAE